MRKGSRIAPLILLGIVLVGLALYCVWPHERSYQGRPFSQWLEEYQKVRTNVTDLVQQRKDEARFAALGPAVVPDLVKVLERRAGLKLDNKLGLFFHKFSATGRMGFWLDSKVLAAQDRWFEANYLLGVMGPQAECAIPAMLRIYQNTNEPPPVRADILSSLARINRRPDLVMPVLAESLSDVELAPQTAFALAEFGTNAISAMPALLETLHHPDMLNALAAAQTIHRIDPKASLAAVDEVMPLLVRALQSSVRVNQVLAFPLLAQYGNRAKEAVPLLVKIRDEAPPWLSEQAAGALKQIDPEAAAKAGVQ